MKTPCLHLSQKLNSIIKKLKERVLSFPGKLPAPSILVNFAFEIWEREAAPADYCLYGRLSMDVSNAHITVPTTLGRRSAVCCLNVLFVIMGS